MRRVFAIVVVTLAVLAPSNPVSAQVARVDPRVLADTAGGAKAPFLVVLRSQANTRALAAAEPDRAARGRVIFDALRRAANAAQPAVRAQLDALGVRYRAYSVVNLLGVE